MVLSGVDPVSSLPEEPVTQKSSVTNQPLPPPPSVAAHSDTVSISNGAIQAANSGYSDGYGNFR
jgi:hypothetical protein